MVLQTRSRASSITRRSVSVCCALSLLVAVGIYEQADAGVTGPLEIGSLAGEPGEVVAVPCFASYDESLRAFAIFFQFDVTRLEFERFDISGSPASESFGPVDVIHRTFDPPGDAVAGIVNNSTNLDLEFRRIPPGERQHLGDLVFRIRADAPVGPATVAPVESVPGTAGATSLNFGETEMFVDEFVDGAVEVRVPDGPRPVGNIACTQFLDRSELSFTLTEVYDVLEVRRDGILVATLDGAENSYVERLPTTGKFVYSVTAERGDSRSIATSCELLAVSPAAPPVSDLECDEGRLSWTNGVQFDSIVVFRDGVEIAQIEGSATSFTDADRGDRARVLYTVVSVLEGFRSPGVHCIDPGVWLVELGDVQVPLDAPWFSIPVFLTTSGPAQGWDVYLELPNDRFTLSRSIERTLEGTAWLPNPEFIGIGLSGLTGFPAAGILYDHLPPNEAEKDLPAGLRQHVLNFVFAPTGEFEDGEVIDVDIIRASFSIRGPGSATSLAPDALIPSRIFMGRAGPRAVENLVAVLLKEAPRRSGAQVSGRRGLPESFSAGKTAATTTLSASSGTVRWSQRLRVTRRVSWIPARRVACSPTKSMVSTTATWDFPQARSSARSRRAARSCAEMHLTTEGSI